MSHPWDRRLGFWYLAQDHPDLLAIVASPTGVFTYAEFAGRAHQLVHLLRSEGLGVEDVVAVLLPNDVHIVEASLACAEGGFQYLLLNTALTAAELDTILAHSGTKALIVHDRFAGSLPDELPPVVFSVGEVPGVRTLEDARAAHPTTQPDDRVCGSLFSYTSGTTGRPKGIKRPRPPGDPSEVASQAAVFGRAFDFRPLEGPMLVSTGMFHGGSHSYYIGGLHVGHGLVIMGKFDPEEALRLIETNRVTSGYMVPTQFHRLLRLPAEVRRRYDVSSLHSIVHSAAPCPRDVKEQMLAWWGPVVWETYGGMEGPVTIAKPHRWLEKPGTVGRAIKGVTIKIYDDDGKELPAGEIGNIYYGSGSPTFEYVGDPETTKAIYRNGFHTIGDIGYLDEDGYLFIRDRAKDMIISGGVNIFPQEVEAALLAHSAVADVAVIGVPDPDWGESVKAVVQPAAGVVGSAELETELLAHCRDRLAGYKCPRSVDFRDELPRTEAGKLLKRRIRDDYWAPQG